jgi:hypothetical protein
MAGIFESSIAQNHRTCGIDDYYKNIPVQNLPLGSGLETRNTMTLTIVVHVVWNKTNENISDEQIVDQIDRLNTDFNDPFTDKQNVPPEFRAVIANPQIRFCLASKDPSGKPHTGITRVKTTIPFIGSQKNINDLHIIHYTNLGGTDAWDTHRYINIWVGALDNIFGRSTIGGHVIQEAEDGIVIDPEYFKTDLKTNKFGRTLVHEMGHYLGLLHTWGMNIGDCNEDDGLDDTPIQEGPYYDCPSYPQLSCGISNMYMNYMDYVDDICTHLFTKDQVRLMMQTLSTSRNTLVAFTDACNTRPGPVYADSVDISILPRLGLLTIELKNLPDQIIYFTVFNVLGQKTGEAYIHITRQGEINIKDWPRGIYFLYFRYNKEQKTIKIFKP